MTYVLRRRVSYKAWFVSKEPKLGLKLVSALSETKRLLSIVLQNSETAGFGFLVEPKLTTLDVKQL
jgi:hypothetical protein